MKRQPQGGFLIGRIHQAGRQRFARILRAKGIRLNPQQGRILFLLWREGPLPITEIARRTSLGKSTLTAMLDRLERDGHLRRIRSGDDRRVILIEATAHSGRDQQVYAEASQAMARIFYAGFSPARIQRFERDLNLILDNLSLEEDA